jgi:hypothetical protein
MNESRAIFSGRIEKAHIQLAEFEEWYKYYKEGKAISGISELELEKLLNDLENDIVLHSNDMVIEMIIDKVKMNTGDLLNKEVLDNIQIAYITNDDHIIASAYPKYSDGSLYVEIGSKIEERIFLLSDLFAIQFLRNESLSEIEHFLLDGLHKSCVEKYMSNCKNTEEYNRIQMLMLIYEKIVGSEKFSDDYVSYSREIYEMALAFLIGHEIGHHHYGHTDRNAKNDDDPKLKELKADLFGIEFAMTYLKNSYPSDEKRYGLHQFAGMYIPIIASAELCSNIFEDGKSHLSIYKRIGIIDHKLERIIDSESFESIRGYILQLLNDVQFERHAIIEQ